MTPSLQCANVHPRRDGRLTGGAEPEAEVAEVVVHGDGAVGLEDPVLGLRTQFHGSLGERVAAPKDAVGLFVPHDVLGIGQRDGRVAPRRVDLVEDVDEVAAHQVWDRAVHG